MWINAARAPLWRIRCAQNLGACSPGRSSKWKRWGHETNRNRLFVGGIILFVPSVASQADLNHSSGLCAPMRSLSRVPCIVQPSPLLVTTPQNPNRAGVKENEWHLHRKQALYISTSGSKRTFDHSIQIGIKQKRQDQNRDQKVRYDLNWNQSERKVPTAGIIFEPNQNLNKKTDGIHSEIR